MMRLPIAPLMFAAIVIMSSVSLFLRIDVALLGSYDPRYAAFNGTAVVQTASMPTDYRYFFIYGGPGTLTTSTSIPVYALDLALQLYTSKPYDLGKYLPVRLVVTSGSLPVNTYLTWTDPYGGRTRVLYLTSSGIALIIGTATVPLGEIVPVIVTRYVVDEGNTVMFYPISRSEIDDPGYLCSIARGALTPPSKILVTLVDVNYYNCLTSSWFAGWQPSFINMGTGTYFDLRPPGFSVDYYKVTITGSSYSLDLYLGFWFFTTSDPGFFAVVPR